jgi:hypothetical protein
MQTDLSFERRLSWPVWAEALRRRGLEDVIAWALEAAGPLGLLGAQALYMGGPLFRPLLSDAALEDLTCLLEDDEARRAFLALLQEEKPA